jgi:hypothetical protein
MQQGRPRRGEWVAVAFWAALGVALAVAGWRMDRLAHLGIAPWSAPGLLPGVVGVAMVALAAALAWRLRGRDEPAQTEPAQTEPAHREPAHREPALADPGAGHFGASALTAVLCLAFAGLALGRGWPFQLEAALFVFAFIVTFGAAAWRAEGRLARGLALALAVAVVAAFGISTLFEQVFLVRLP